MDAVDDTGRPLAVDREEFGRRYTARLPLYEGVARAVLPEGGGEAGAQAAPWLAALRELPKVRIAWARSATGSYPAAVGTRGPRRCCGSRVGGRATRHAVVRDRRRRRRCATTTHCCRSARP